MKRRPNAALWLMIGIPIVGAILSLTTLVVALTVPAAESAGERSAMTKTSWRE